MKNMKNIGLFVTTVTLVILATTFVLATGSFATINDVAVNGVEDFGPNDTVAVLLMKLFLSELYLQLLKMQKMLE